MSRCALFVLCLLMITGCSSSIPGQPDERVLTWTEIGSVATGSPLIYRAAVIDDAVVFLKVENLFDEEAIVSRQPDGARPNKPRTASVGVEWTF